MMPPPIDLNTKRDSTTCWSRLEAERLNYDMRTVRKVIRAKMPRS
jgi:hypothetical protein